MKKIIYALLLTLCLATIVWADGKDDTLHTAGTTGQNFTRQGMNSAVTSTNLFEVIVSTAAGSDSALYYTSSDNGATWTNRGSLFAAYSASSSYPTIFTMSDTGYAMRNCDGAPAILAKTFGTTISFRQTLTAGNEALSRSCMGLTADGSPVAITDTVTGLGIGPYSYSGTGWASAYNWTKGTAVTPGSNRFPHSFPLLNGIGTAYLVNNDSIRFYWTDGSAVTSTPKALLPAPELNSLENFWAISKSYSSDTFYVFEEVADSLRYGVFVINNSTHEVSQVRIGTIESPNSSGDTQYARHCPSLGMMGDTLYAVYKFWDGTYWDICYKKTGNGGQNWSARTTLRDFTAAPDSIIDLQCPPWFNNSGDGNGAKTVEVFWTNGGAVGAMITMAHVDTVGTVVSCTTPTNSFSWIASDTTDHPYRDMVKSDYGASVLDSIVYSYKFDSLYSGSVRFGAYPDSGTTHTIIIPSLFNNRWYWIWARTWNHEGAETCYDSDSIHVKTKFKAWPIYGHVGVVK